MAVNPDIGIQMKRNELTKTRQYLNLVSMGYTKIYQRFNPFKPDFTTVIFIHYKQRIAVAILDL